MRGFENPCLWFVVLFCFCFSVLSFFSLVYLFILLFSGWICFFFRPLGNHHDSNKRVDSALVKVLRNVFESLAWVSLLARPGHTRRYDLLASTCEVGLRLVLSHRSSH